MQRSRITWLKDRDRNTIFFQSKYVWRARKTRIKKLEDTNGNLFTKYDEIGHATTEYFKHIWIQHLLLISLVLLLTMLLTLPYARNFVSEKEISDACFQIGPLKAPGLDGFPVVSFSATGAL